MDRDNLQPALTDLKNLTSLMTLALEVTRRLRAAAIYALDFRSPAREPGREHFCERPENSCVGSVGRPQVRPRCSTRVGGRNAPRAACK